MADPLLDSSSALISKKKKRRDKHGSKDEGPDALEKQTKRKRETVDVDETDAALAADRKQKKKKKHGERSDAVDVERLEPFSATFPITEQEDKEKRKKEKKRKRDTDDSAAVSHSDVVVAEEHVEKKKKKKKSKDKKCDTDDPGVVSISDAVAQENNRNEGAIGSSAPQVSAEVVENESVEEKRKKKRKRDAEQASLEGNTLVGPDGAAEEPALKKKKKSKGRETEREQKKASPLPQNSVSAVFNADFDSNDDILRVIQGLDMTTFEGGTPEPVPVASSSRSRKASSSSKPKRAKAAASQLNLNHAELLATKWMTPKQLDDLAKTEGLVFKKGKFAATEIKLLNDAIENYRKTRSLAESDIVNLVFPSDDTQKDPTFWTEITSALDQRPIRAVWNYLRRACNDAGRQGKWKADEDARLIQAVTSLGQQWEKVSELVGRMAGDCKDRYRNHIVDLDKREYGTWSAEDEAELTKIVREMHQGQDLDNDILWTRVAERMGGKRSRTQCRAKWMDSLNRKNKGNHDTRWSRLDTYILVHKVANLQVEDDTEVDWKTLPDPTWNFWSAHLLQRRWKGLKEGIKGGDRLSHTEIVDLLVKKYPQKPQVNAAKSADCVVDSDNDES